MAQKITYPNKSPGDQHLASEMNEVKSVVNANADDLEASGEVILSAASFANQIPSGLGAPLQVEFGPAVNGPGDDVEIDANGVLTFNVTGKYIFNSIFTIQRTSQTQTANLFLRLLLNGSQFGNSLGTEMTSDDTNALSATLFLDVVATDQVIIEFVRDASGNNDGQLTALTPTGAVASWNKSPSAEVQISKQSV